MKPDHQKELKIEMKKLLRQYKTAYNKAAPYNKKMDELRQQLKDMSVGSGLETDVAGAHTILKSGFIRTSWKTAPLMELAEQVPDILACRKDTHVQPTITIKLGDRVQDDETE